MLYYCLPERMKTQSLSTTIIVLPMLVPESMTMSMGLCVQYKENKTTIRMNISEYISKSMSSRSPPPCYLYVDRLPVRLLRNCKHSISELLKLNAKVRYPLFFSTAAKLPFNYFSVAKNQTCSP